MRPFVALFKEVGEKETRRLEIVRKGAVGSLPVDEYAFIESYCHEKDCDCRRVMISVIGQKAEKIFATISMGFDSGEDDAGPFLDPLNPQTKHSKDLLNFFLNMINTDLNYLARLQRHYVMFKEKIDGRKYRGRPFEEPGKVARKEKFPDMPPLPSLKPPVRKPSEVGRNDPCPCGSGKKYKKCCLLKEREGRSGAPEARSAVAPSAAGRSGTGVMAEELTGKRAIEDARAMVRAAARRRERGTDQRMIDLATQDLLQENPLIAFALLELLLEDYAPRETTREMSPNYQACLLLFEEALTQIRYSVERNRTWAVDAAERIQREIAERAFRVEVDARVHADLARTIYDAKLEIHPEIKSRTEKLEGYYGGLAAERGVSDLDGLLSEIVSHGLGNPFALTESLMGELNLLPVEKQVFTVTEMAGAKEPRLREVATLMLLHPNREVRGRLPYMFIERVDPGTVSPVSLRRMIGLRDWLPEAERPAMDRLIGKVREAHVKCAPMPPLQRARTYASSFDGAGAQGVWTVVKRKRGLQLASVLLKQGMGIRDIMKVGPLDKKEMDAMIRDLEMDAMAKRIEPSYMERAIPHFIWVGQQQGNVPQAALLEVAEALGDTYWSPRRVVLEEELSALEKEADPGLLTSEKIEQVMEESRYWPAEKRFASSWFEDDARVDDIVRSIAGFPSLLGTGVIEDAADRILEEVIEDKYDLWAERLLLMTLWARACQSRAPLPWEDFFIVARQFSRGVPPEEIPLLVAAAERSVFSGVQRLKSRPQ